MAGGARPAEVDVGTVHSTLLQVLDDLGVAVLLREGDNVTPVNAAGSALAGEVVQRLAGLAPGHHEVAATDGTGRRARVEVEVMAVDGPQRLIVVRDVTDSKLAYARERKRAEQL